MAFSDLVPKSEVTQSTKRVSASSERVAQSQRPLEGSRTRDAEQAQSPSALVGIVGSSLVGAIRGLR